MTREEVKMFLLKMDVLIPKPDFKDLPLTIDSWAAELIDVDAKTMNDLLSIYIRTSGSAFKPSLAQLFQLQAEETIDHLEEGEIRDILVMASRNANYGSEDEYRNMPRALQRAVGSPAVIKSWGMMEPSELEYAISRVIRTYNTLVDKGKRTVSIPDRLSPETNRKSIDDLVGRTLTMMQYQRDSGSERRLLPFEDDGMSFYEDDGEE